LELYQAIRVSFLGCKWHGVLDTPTNSVAHVYLNQTYLTMFSGCRFANSLTDMLDALNASGLLVNDCLINGAQVYGMHLTSTNYSVITGNYMQNTTADPNITDNNVIQTSCTGNNVADNVKTAW
jgi:hypothetical protein